MSDSSALLLVGAVAAVGVLHTIVPDHWVPIALMARQRGWSRAQTMRVAFKAGIGHVVSTLLIGAIVWLAGVAVAQRFGHWVDTLASVALVGFGLWIALSAWRDLHGRGGHGHSHEAPNGTSVSTFHGPELQRLRTEHGALDLSIYENGVPPRFRLSGNCGDYWESVDEIPEPHQFSVTLTIDHDGHAHQVSAQFIEHGHGPAGHGHA